MLIKNFFKDQEIFISGATGFVGQALVEKLLRSCPGVKTIFVLLRPKRGKTVEDRLQKYIESVVFKRIQQTQPEALKKVQAIAGNCKSIGLGISEEDLKRLSNVTIIYHSAASVRFNDPLREAILLNTRGTWEMCKFAETLTNLKAFIHISTTYCNTDRTIVEEKIYPCVADWRTTIKLAENYGEELLNIVFPKYSRFKPNTYTFTKALSEQIINDYSDKLPMAILRPSIVASSVAEPFPGWVDGFNGPFSLCIVGGHGLIRVLHGDPNVPNDYVPVDIVVRAIITLSYKIGSVNMQNATTTASTPRTLEVVNCASNDMVKVTLKDVCEIGRLTSVENPFKNAVYVPNLCHANNKLVYLLIVFLLQLPMSVMLDGILIAAKRQPFVMKIQRIVFNAAESLFYFTNNTWTFQNNYFKSINNCISSEETAEFEYIKLFDIDFMNYFRNALKGMKEFLLNEPPMCSKATRRRMAIFQIVHICIKSFAVIYLVRYVAKIIFQML